MDTSNQTPAGPKTILLIDDDTELLSVNKKILTALGYSVITAPGGRAGIEILEAQGADLVLLDMLMPEMDGVDVLRHIRETRPDQKVIILSAYADADKVDAVIDLGIMAYLRKPLPIQELAAAIDKALSGIPAPVKPDELG